MCDMVTLEVSCVRFRHLHADVGRDEGALIVIPVQRSRWAGMDSSSDVIVSR